MIPFIQLRQGAKITETENEQRLPGTGDGDGGCGRQRGSGRGPLWWWSSSASGQRPWPQGSTRTTRQLHTATTPGSRPGPELHAVRMHGSGGRAGFVQVPTMGSRSKGGTTLPGDPLLAPKVPSRSATAAIPQPRGPRGPWCSSPTRMSLSLRRREWVFWFGTCAPLPLAPWQGVLWAHREGCDRPRGRPGETRPASSACGRRAPVRGLPVPCSASGAQTDHTPPGRLEWGQGTAGLYTD